MSLASAVRPPAELAGGRRHFLVGHLPLLASALFLLVLLWSGARAWEAPADGRPSLDAAWTTAAALGAGELVVLTLGVTVAAILLHPFQLALVRLLEGGWPRRLGGRWAGERAVRRHLARKRAWEKAAALPPGDPEALTEEQVRQAGLAGRELRRRYPLPDHLVRPTALGNALAAMEDGAGRPYGLDAVAAWPRIYPVLGDRTRALVDDGRDSVDAAARMAVVMAAAFLASAVLLARCGGWLALSLPPLVAAWLSYRGAVQAALAYGESVHVAFDLHRLDLLAALRLERPEGPAAERALNRQLSDLWRQGVPLDPALRYTAEPEGPDGPDADGGRTR
ncbi:hypothetical protein [Streptomyces sp. SBT349]|uniref:hypothetical protein n=1 Tax=Streptomyces sp. SBT349 TaxID=1580539 RepID=UPI00066AEB34|nr:hypothetical protein [Streptomyces sp. SBT349]